MLTNPITIYAKNVNTIKTKRLDSNVSLIDYGTGEIKMFSVSFQK